MKDAYIIVKCWVQKTHGHGSHTHVVCEVGYVRRQTWNQKLLQQTVAHTAGNILQPCQLMQRSFHHRVTFQLSCADLKQIMDTLHHHQVPTLTTTSITANVRMSLVHVHAAGIR